MNNKLSPSHVHTIGLYLVYRYIIKGNFGTNHSIKSVYYLEIQMLVVHKINYILINFNVSLKKELFLSSVKPVFQIIMQF